MKLHVEMLGKLIALPTPDMAELRHVLDDLGLEVKGIEGEGAKTVFTIETLANRGDHLFALGVAREFAARYLSQISVPAMAAALPDRAASVPVKLNTQKCPRYGLLELQIPERTAARPEVLAAMGGGSEKPAIVDTLNFIQLELGQPMHAFDKDKIDGEIRVELSEEEEKIEGLDGKTYQVPVGSIMIRDRKKTVAVGGVIGCANSMVTSATTRVLVESASFEPVSVRKTARAMGLSTDASYLFERGCDAEMPQPALKRLLYLMGGTPGVSGGGGSQAIGFTWVETEPVEKRQVQLRLAALRAECNLPRLNEAEVAARLKCLGYGVRQDEKEFAISVPSWRLWDVKNEADLIEDFVRSHGLNGVKQELPPFDEEPKPLNEVDLIRGRLDEVFHGSGFIELIATSFYSPRDVELFAKIDAATQGKLVQVTNAVEGNFAYLRHTSVLHHARIAAENLKMGVRSCKGYEYTRHFAREGADDRRYEFERDVLACSMAGRWFLNEWRQEESREEKLRLFKGLIESLGTALGVTFAVAQGDSPWLHPGCQATLSVGRTVVGFFGLVHPLIREGVGTNADVFYGEFDVLRMVKVLAERPYPQPSDFPMIRRDLTLKVPLRMYASKVQAAIRDSKPEHLHEIAVMDEFRKAGEDFRRITFRLSFQSAERTLEHAEIDAEVQKVLSTLGSWHQLELAA